MSLFVCEKCGVIENTACCSYWALAVDALREKKKLKWSDELKSYEGKKFLCSECATIKYDALGNNPVVIPGEWHSKFDKEFPSDKELYRMRKEHRIIN